MKPIILILLLLLSHERLAAQSKHPSLTLTDTNGKRFQLSDYKGKVVLLNFWATWCPPCRTEIPDLVKLQQQYRSRGLRIIGVTYPPEKLSEVRSFSRRAKMNYRVAIGTKETKAVFTASDVLPITVVLDRDVVIRNVIEGIMYQDEFDQKVKPLLLPPAPVAKSRVAAAPSGVELKSQRSRLRLRVIFRQE